MATPTEIREAAAIQAEEGIAEAQDDMGTVKAMDPLKQLEAARQLEANSVLDGENTQGGPRSAWACTRPARFVPPGAH